jgi:uncharacterized membrane protein
MSVSVESSLLTSFDYDSVAHKWWKEICFAAWLFFILFETAIRYNQLYSNQPLCPYSDLDVDKEWYWPVRYATLGGVILILITVIVKILQMKKKDKKVPLYIAFHIIALGINKTIFIILQLALLQSLLIDFLRHHC